MFDLDQAIALWRRQMFAKGVNSADVLKELESHLREDIDEQMRSGLDARRAFEAAVVGLGKAELLGSEFANAGAKRRPVWQTADLKIALLVCVLLLVFTGLTVFKAGVWSGITFIGAVIVTLLIIFSLRDAVRRAGASLETAPLTPDTIHTLELARREASRYHHDFVGTEHLLLGLLDKGIVPEVLRRLGIESSAIRTEVENLVSPGPQHEIASTLPCTPRAERALRLASVEAKAMQQTHVRPECLFLGLLLEGTGVAALALKNLGLDFQRTRAEILKVDRPNG
jgi:hypothetical protein